MVNPPIAKEVAMRTHLLNAAALAAILTAGSAFAADAPAPTAPAMPAASTSAMPAATAKPATAAKTEMPASKPEMASGKPAVRHMTHVSACTLSIERAEKVLAKSAVSAENIAMAWQHIGAAKQDRLSHQAKACTSESQTATKLLEGKA
jgi:hypothetical protein